MEKFEKEGRWWLPSNPKDFLPGKLSFDPNIGGTLELIGKFDTGYFDGGHRLFDKVELFHDTVRGTAFTLCRCRAETNSTRNWIDFSVSQYSVEFIYEGYHFRRTEDIRFGEVSLGYTYLDDWVGDDNLDNEVNEVGHRSELLKPFEVPSADCKIFLRHEHRVDRLTRTFAEVADVSRITMVSPKKKPYSEYRQLIDLHIPTFLSLATLNSNFPLDIKGRVEDNVGPIGVYYKMPAYGEKSQSLGWWHMLFTFDNVKDNL